MQNATLNTENTHDIHRRTADIFELRRNGQLKEALTRARELLGDAPGDPWVNKACGWVLIDLCRQAHRDHDTKAMQQYLTELQAVLVEPADDVFTANRAHWLFWATDVGQKLLEAEQLAAAKRYAEALAMMERLMPQSESARMRLRYGWTLVRYLNSFEKNTIDPEMLRDLLARYATHCSGEPSRLHSALLGAAIRHSEKLETFVAFVRFWDPRCLRQEDYKGEKNGENEYPSLAERLVKALARHIKKERAVALDDAAWLKPLFADALKRYPKQEWFPYYQAVLLHRCGEKPAAAAQMLPVLQRKHKQFWAWMFLGECLSDAKHKRALLCRALQCRIPRREMSVGVYDKLIPVLLALKQYDAARDVTDRCLAIRREKGWKGGQWVQANTAQSWYTAARPFENWDAFIAQHASGADAVVRMLKNPEKTN
jgi:hypothetical protein